MSKMLEDNPDMDMDVALQYCVSVRNCSMYVRGFTPAQLAIGCNPRLPSVFHDEDPALESYTSSPTIAHHLNSMEAARQSFVKAEISAKLKKALKHPVREFCDKFYSTGQNVYYKMPTEDRWLGPAKVIGSDGKVIIVKHGSVLRRVHPRHIQLLGSSADSKIDPQRPASAVVCKKNVSNPETNKMEYLLPVGENGDSEYSQSITKEDVEMIGGREKNELPKKNIIVNYEQMGKSFQNVKIMGNAGKRTGKNKNWLNVQDGEGNKWSVDWTTVDRWERVEINSDLNETEKTEETSPVFLSGVFENCDDFKQAKMDELNKWREFGVYDIVDDVGQETLTGRWICN